MKGILWRDFTPQDIFFAWIIGRMSMWVSLMGKGEFLRTQMIGMVVAW
jgi:hypothetical protein